MTGASSSVLFRNASDNATQVWFMDGHRISGRISLMAEDGQTPMMIGPPWEIVGVGDLNGNGKADILFRNASDNATQVWFMDGHRISGRISLMAEDGQTAMMIGPPWEILGVGDFNGNGKADILFRNTADNATQVWFMDGHRISGRISLMAEDGQTPMMIGPPWEIVGVGDFNGDGKADILFRNTADNATQVWFMDGHRISGRISLMAEDGQTPMMIGPPWEIVGVGDFNGDGKADILFRNTADNATQVWFMDGHRISGRISLMAEDGQTPMMIGPPWEVTGVATEAAISNISISRIQRFYRGTGGSLGPLGPPAGDIVRNSNGGVSQQYLLGEIHLNDIDGVAQGSTQFEVEVELSAVKCFGTEDPGGTDETFVIVSLTSINPNFSSGDSLVLTQRTEIINNVTGGAVIFKKRPVGRVRATGGGLKIHVAIFDHESGDANDLRDQIHRVLEDSARQGAQLLAGAAAGGDQRLAGAVGDVTEFEVGGVKPFKILTLGIADLLADLLSDDLIGEHEFIIPAQNIKNLADQEVFNVSCRRKPQELGADVQFNWPVREADEPLLSGGGGSYKVFFTITPIKITRPTEPAIQF